MTEEFLYHIWQFRLFNHRQLKTHNGESIEILHPGNRNRLSGPDFFNTKIKIEDLIWAGNVEIHVNASDWFKHAHQKDDAYQNIILHVVYENDMPVKRKNSEREIPTIELKGRVPRYLVDKYSNIVKSKTDIPCQKFVGNLNQLDVNLWLNRLIIERLERKSNYIKAYWIKSNKNWRETFYYLLARNYGFNQNADPFEQLAFATPLKVLGKHKNKLFQLEAILLGQSGLLDEPNDDYSKKLYIEYEFLRKKYQLKPLEKKIWKKGGVRPGNSPAIRIAQFATLIHQTSSLFSRIIECGELMLIKKTFEKEASEYWQVHYSLGKTSKKHQARLGEASVQNVMINTVVPLIYSYGKELKNEQLKEQAIDFLYSLKAEKNSVIEKWKRLNIQIPSAFESQAILQQYKEYCIKKKCLNCGLGKKILIQKP